jgi:hypothetical protein
VTNICDGAFTFCENLTNITFNGTVAEWNAIEKGVGWNDDVPVIEVICLDGIVTVW